MSFLFFDQVGNPLGMFSLNLEPFTNISKSIVRNIRTAEKVRQFNNTDRTSHSLNKSKPPKHLKLRAITRPRPQMSAPKNGGKSVNSTQTALTLITALGLMAPSLFPISQTTFHFSTSKAWNEKKQTLSERWTCWFVWITNAIAFRVGGFPLMVDGIGLRLLREPLIFRVIICLRGCWSDWLHASLSCQWAASPLAVWAQSLHSALVGKGFQENWSWGNPWFLNLTIIGGNMTKFSNLL